MQEAFLAFLDGMEDGVQSHFWKSSWAHAKRPIKESCLLSNKCLLGDQRSQEIHFSGPQNLRRYYLLKLIRSLIISLQFLECIFSYIGFSLPIFIFRDILTSLDDLFIPSYNIDLLLIGINICKIFFQLLLVIISSSVRFLFTFS